MYGYYLFDSFDNCFYDSGSIFDCKSDAEEEVSRCLVECPSCDHYDIYFLED